WRVSAIFPLLKRDFADSVKAGSATSERRRQISAGRIAHFIKMTPHEDIFRQWAKPLARCIFPVESAIIASEVTTPMLLFFIRLHQSTRPNASFGFAESNDL